MPRYVALRKALGRGVLAAAILAAIAYLAAAPGHPARAQTAAGLASEEELDVVAFSGFQLRFEELNQRVGQAIGEPPFVSAEDLGGRTVRVTANPSWLENGLRQRTRNAMTLHRIWRAVNGLRKVKVIIADGGGAEQVVVSDLEGPLKITAKQ